MVKIFANNFVLAQTINPRIMIGGSVLTLVIIGEAILAYLSWLA